MADRRVIPRTTGLILEMKVSHLVDDGRYPRERTRHPEDDGPHLRDEERYPRDEGRPSSG